MVTNGWTAILVPAKNTICETALMVCKTFWADHQANAGDMSGKEFKFEALQSKNIPHPRHEDKGKAGKGTCLPIK
jgi:hypothetical protein